MSSRLRVGLDVDGVLFPWEETARQCIFNEYGISLPQSTHWDDIKNAVSVSVWKWLWDETGGLKRAFSNGLPFPDCWGAVVKMSMMADIVIITSTPRGALWDRLAWLERWDFPVHEIHVTMQKKSTVPRCDVYIDDASHNIEDLRQIKDSTVILWDRPWNQEVEVGGNVVRCKDWDSVINIVKGRAA